MIEPPSDCFVIASPTCWQQRNVLERVGFEEAANICGRYVFKTFARPDCSRIDQDIDSTEACDDVFYKRNDFLFI